MILKDQVLHLYRLDLKTFHDCKSAPDLLHLFLCQTAQVSDYLIPVLAVFSVWFYGTVVIIVMMLEIPVELHTLILVVRAVENR